MFIIKDSHPFKADPTVETAFYVISWIFMIIALVLTVVSMLDYLAKCRDVLRFVPEPENDADKNASADEQPVPSTTQADTSSPLKSDSSTSTVLEEGSVLYKDAKRILALAQEKKATLSTAESCTGGLIAGVLTAVPGSSAVVEGGIVSYSNDVKHHVLKVSADDLEKFGAVSEPVARQMAQGSRDALSTTIAVSVTGIAGPGGERPGKPVGTVWFGLDSPNGTKAEVKHFAGDRESVRTQTVAHALSLFEQELKTL